MECGPRFVLFGWNTWDTDCKFVNQYGLVMSDAKNSSHFKITSQFSVFKYGSRSKILNYGRFPKIGFAFQELASQRIVVTKDEPSATQFIFAAIFWCPIPIHGLYLRYLFFALCSFEPNVPL